MSQHLTTAPLQPVTPPRDRAAQDRWIESFLNRPMGGGDSTGPAAAVSEAQARYIEALAAAKATVGELTDPLIGAEKLAIERDRIAPAEAAAAKGEYDAALDLLGEVATACGDARAILQLHAGYQSDREIAQAHLDALTDPLIAADKAKIEADFLDKAAVLVRPNGDDYSGATRLLSQVEGACAAATSLVQLHAAYEDARKTAQQKLDILTEPVIVADAAKIKTDFMDKAAGEAAQRTYPAAMSLLAQVDGACNDAKAVAQLHAAYEGARDTAQQKLDTLTEPVIAADKAKIKTDFMDKAAEEAANRTYPAAMSLLAQVDGACNDAKAVAQLHAAYESARDTAQQKLDTLIEPVIATDKAKIKTDFMDKAAEEAANRAYPAAMSLLAQVDGACQTAKDIAARHAEYTIALADIEGKLAGLTQPVVATEVAGITSTCVDPAKVLATSPARDYAGAMALLGQATPRWETAELHSRRYAAGLARAEAGFNNTTADAQAWINDWTTWGSPTLLGVSDVLADIKTNNLDAGKSRAAAGDYAGAMPLLEKVGTRLPDVWKTLGQYKTYWQDQNPKWQTYQAALGAAPTPAIAAAVQAINPDTFDLAVAQARAGNYTAAQACNAGVRARLDAVTSVTNAWTAADAAIQGLTDATVTTDKAWVQTNRLDAAGALITGNDLAGATALLAKVPDECTAITAYAAALGPANLAVGALPTPAAQADIVRIRRDYIDAARARADAQDHAGATALLLNVPDECAAATTAATAPDQGPARAQQFETLRAAAEAKINGLPTEVDPEKTTIRTTMLQAAVTAAGGGDLSGGMQLLAGVAPAVAAAAVLATQAQAYTAALGLAQTAIGGLAAGFIDPDIADVRTNLIDAAATAATARNFTAALDLLAKVQPKCTAAQAVADVHADYVPAAAGLVANHQMAQDNLNLATGNGMPGAPYQAQIDDVQNNNIVAANALVTGRTLCDPLPLRQALDLVKKGQEKAINLPSATFYYLNNAWYRGQADTGLNALQAHAGGGAVAVELAALGRLLADGDTLTAQDQQEAAARLYQEVSWGCAAATKIAGQQETYDTALGAAQTRVRTCKTQVDGLSPAVPAITAAFQGIDMTLMAPAAVNAAGRSYDAAGKLLAEVDATCTQLEALVTQHGNYATTLTAAENAVGLLTDPAIAGEARRIADELINPAKAKAASLDYTAALALLGKVQAACAAAIAIAAGSQQTANDRAAAHPAIEAAATDPTAAADAVQRLLDGVLARPEAAAVKDLTDQIAGLIGQARSGAPGAAQQLLTQAADLCVTARQAAERHAVFAQALTTAEGLVNGLTEPLISADRARIQRTRIDAAKSAVVPALRDYATAMTLLGGVEADCKVAQEVRDQDTDYQAKLLAAQNAIAALTSLAPTLEPERQTIQTDRIDAAAALVPGRDYAGALKLLAMVAGECKALEVKNKMLAGGAAPSGAEFQEVMNGPDGAKLLDRMIAGLPDNCPREMLTAAIQARFGTTLENFTKDATPAAAGKSKSAKKIYELLAKCPEAHATNNPSLQRIERYGGKSGEAENVKRGSLYRSGDATIVLSCGRAKDTADLHPLSNVALALPNVEPDCELVPDSPTSPAPKYFDWTTLHEVGHAIDDRKGFMGGKLDDGAFGGWQMHGRNVLPVAQAIATACNFNTPEAQKYLVAYLLKGNPPVPPAGGRADWADCCNRANAWCDEIRVDKELWGNGGASASHQAGGRVYHEAYPGTWVSYQLAARSRGITGYQFRAPGEWLSELYAAYHSGKLKPSHPAVAWLATL